MKKFTSLLFLAVSTFAYSQKYESINDSLFNVAGELRNQEKYEESNSVLKKVSKYSVVGNKALLEIVYNNYLEKKYDLALENLKKINTSQLEQNQLHEYYIVYTNSLDDSNKSKEALPVYDEAISKFPNSYLLYYNRAVAQVKLENNQAALNDLYKSIEIYPNYYRSHYLLGTLALDNGNLAEGILAITTSILFDTNDNITQASLKMLNYELAKKFEEPKNKITIEGTEQFEGINNVIIKQFALGKNYKLQTDLDITYIRQLQAVMSELSKITTRKGFFAQRYIDFYNKIWQAKQFEIFSYRLFQNFDSQDVQKIIMKKKGELGKFNEGMFTNLMQTNSIRKMQVNGKEEICSVVTDDEYIGYGKIQNNQKVGYWQYFYSQGSLFLEGNYKNNEFDGVIKTYFDNGKLMRKTNYKLGKQTGITEYYNYLGNIVSIRDYLNDKETNLQQYFYPLGGKKSTYSIKGDKVHGKEEAFYENGNLKSVTNYVMGDAHGDFKEYYVDGTIKKTAKYDRNKFIGEKIEYYQDKAIYTKENYVNGNITGDYIKNYANGEVYNQYKIVNGNASYVKTMEANHIDDERFFEGTRLVKQNIYLNNKVALEYTFEGKDGFEHISSYKAFDENGVASAPVKLKTNTPFVIKLANGNKYLEGTYNSKGQKNGEFKYYDIVTGLLNSRTFFDKNIQNKYYEDYYPNGKVKTNFEIKNDKKNGKYIAYFQNGNKSKECEYVNDNIEGEYIRYFKNGKINDISFYVKDELQVDYIDRNNFNGELEKTDYYLGGEIYKTIFHDKNKEHYTLDFNKSGTVKYSTVGQNEFIEATIKNGVYDGPYFIKNSKGGKIFEAKLINGEKHGESISYNPNGTIASKANNIGNQLYGEYVKNNMDGKLYWKSSYLNDSDFGATDKFFHEGFKYITVNYYNDEKHGKEIMYGSNGEILLTLNFISNKIYSYQLPDAKEVIVKNGNLNLVANYKATGKPGVEVNYKNGESIGVFKLYHENGQEIIVNDYQDGQMIRKQWNYSTGKPYLIEELKDNDKNGKLQMFHSNGKPSIEANFVDDDLHGSYKEFDTNGKQTINQVYNFGVLVEIK